MNYRKIYEDTYGIIPVDENGLSFDVHHKDGDRTNNDLLNLEALSIQDHYDRHYQQGDMKACHAISMRMDISGEEKSRLASAANLQRVLSGTNPFVGPRINASKVEDGTHPWLGGAQSSKNARRLVSDGKHPFSGGKIQSESNQKRIQEGTHNFLGGHIQRRQLKDGTHNFQKRAACPHCGMESNAGAIKFHMSRKHKQ